jgi:exo-1,4-beta-D-glucosaminidase
MERKTRGRNETERVVVENPSDNIAFMVRLRLTVGPASQDVTAISWEDNYFSLLRGEKREVSANYEAAALAGRNPKVEVSGWNITARSAP